MLKKECFNKSPPVSSMMSSLMYLIIGDGRVSNNFNKFGKPLVLKISSSGRCHFSKIWLFILFIVCVLLLGCADVREGFRCKKTCCPLRKSHTQWPVRGPNIHAKAGCGRFTWSVGRQQVEEFPTSRDWVDWQFDPQPSLTDLWAPLLLNYPVWNMLYCR